MTTLRVRPLFRLTVVALLLAALAVAGGASRSDAPQQIVVRLAAIVALAATAFPLDIAPLRGDRRWWWIAAAYALIALQSIPLPASLWAILPGHQIYAKIAAETGAIGWRPLSLTPDLTLNALFALLPATAALVAMPYLRAEDRPRIVAGLIGVGLLSALLGLAQLAAADTAAWQIYRVSTEDSATGLFANRNHNAVFLAALLPLVGAATREWRGNGHRIATAAIALLLTIGLIATASRMGLIAGIFGLAAGIAIALSGNRRTRLSRRYLAIAAASLTASAVAVGLTISRSGLFARLATTDLSTESRLGALAPMARTAWAFFPLGAGFGSFDSVYRRFEPLDQLSVIYLNQAHNEPMQLAIEGGVPALVLLGVFLWWWVARLRRIMPQRQPLPLAGAAASAILMLASLVDYPLRTPLGAAFFAICCTLMTAPDRTRPARRMAA